MFKDAQSIGRKLQGFMAISLVDQSNVVQNLFTRLKTKVFYRRAFASLGPGSAIYKPMLLSNPRYMRLGKNVLIRKGARLEAVLTDKDNPPYLEIGDNVNIEQNVHIVCHSRVVIGNGVSITGHCAIVDVIHPYENVNDPVKVGCRIALDRSFVEIGDGTFLGFGAVILPNVRIGRGCVVGTLAVVTRDVPDRSVVAGNPAKVIRRYDEECGAWMRIDQHENRSGNSNSKE
jgi:acetyltransferase-like isoleucine patch superfamily enzyme